MTGGRSRSNAELVFAAALVAVAGGFGWIASGYPAESAAFPQAVAGLLALIASLIAMREIRRRRAGAETPGSFFNHPPRLAAGIAALTAYIAAVGWIGYLLPSLALGALLPLACGYRRLPVTAAVTLAALAFIVTVFVILLERPLPPDVLDGLTEAFR